MQTAQHIYRTTDGRLVLQGHPDATVLVYPAGQEVPLEDRAEVQELLDTATAVPAPGEAGHPGLAGSEAAKEDAKKAGSTQAGATAVEDEDEDDKTVTFGSGTSGKQAGKQAGKPANKAAAKPADK